VLSGKQCVNPPRRLRKRAKNYVDVVTRKLPRLSGFFRVREREGEVICHLRSVKRMSVNHIADVLGRSLQTIHRFTSFVDPTGDNRRDSPLSRSKRVMAFKAKMLELRVRVKMFLDGTFVSIAEALNARSVPLRVLEKFFAELSENSLGEEDEDPA